MLFFQPCYIVGNELAGVRLTFFLCNSGVAKCEAVDVVGHDCWTVVGILYTEGDIFERYAVGVAQVEPPGGKLFPHGEFGVATFPFGDGG